MNSGLNRISLFAALLFLIPLLNDASAQNTRMTERAFVPSVRALGMGDVGGALPSAQSPFFYNPAHAALIDSRTTIFGVQGAVSQNVRDQLDFYSDELEDAIALDFDQSAESLRRLYDETMRVGRDPSQGRVGLMLPATVQRRGNAGYGLGFFTQSTFDYRVGDSGFGIPLVDLVSRTDFVAMGTVAFDLTLWGVEGASVGTNLKYTRRYLSFKSKPLDLFSPSEKVLVLDGSSFGMDLGLQYAVPLETGPGRLTVSATIYDLLKSDFGYEYHGTVNDVPVVGRFVDDESAPPQAVIDAEVDGARDRFDLATSYRFGAAYALERVGLLRDVQVAMDVQAYADPMIDQTFLSKVFLGVQASPVGFFDVRTGLSQGYPSLGAGVELGPVHLDYSFHGLEQGRGAGQIGTHVHTAQVMIQI